MPEKIRRRQKKSKIRLISLGREKALTMFGAFIIVFMLLIISLKG